MIPIMALRLAEGLTIKKVEETHHAPNGEPLIVRIHFTNDTFTDIRMDTVCCPYSGRVQYSYLDI